MVVAPVLAAVVLHLVAATSGALGRTAIRRLVVARVRPHREPQRDARPRARPAPGPRLPCATAQLRGRHLPPLAEPGARGAPGGAAIARRGRRRPRARGARRPVARGRDRAGPTGALAHARRRRDRRARRVRPTRASSWSIAAPSQPTVRLRPRCSWSASAALTALAIALGWTVVRARRIAVGGGPARDRLSARRRRPAVSRRHSPDRSATPTSPSPTVLPQSGLPGRCRREAGLRRPDPGRAGGDPDRSERRAHRRRRPRRRARGVRGAGANDRIQRRGWRSTTSG